MSADIDSMLEFDQVGAAGLRGLGARAGSAGFWDSAPW